MKQLPLAMRVRERARFDSFVSGGNAIALEQLQALSLGTRAGAVWLSGPSGVGKSHLLQASCAAASARGLVSAYLPLLPLRELGVDSLEGWNSARLVALDDVDSVAGQRSWEQALFNLYRELDEQGGALILAAREPPQRLAFSLPDLASRFAGASAFTLQPLDEAQQREALRRRAQARGLELPAATARYLQRRFRRDLNTLYQLFDEIDQASLQAQRRLTVPFIRDVLARRAGAE